MSRTAVAFLIAPLWVPAAVAPFAISWAPYSEQRHWIYITIIIATIFGYGGTLMLGLPAFLILAPFLDAASVQLTLKDGTTLEGDATLQPKSTLVFSNASVGTTNMRKAVKIPAKSR